MVILPESFNYMSLFLTFKCRLGCKYCINRSGVLQSRKEMGYREWSKVISRLPHSTTLPITLSGGEPTQYRDFYHLIPYLPIGHTDLLTNGLFDMKEWKSKVPSTLFSRTAPYASIRVSYHPGYHDPFELLTRVAELRRLAYDIGIWAVDHPEWSTHIHRMKKIASTTYRIDYRLKEFLGIYKDRLLGTYAYPAACHAESTRSALCKGSELLVDPSGVVFRCHRDMYANENALGHILDDSISDTLGKWLPCPNLGNCNECDIKVKYDRFQIHGHCSVQIQDYSHETAK